MGIEDTSSFLVFGVAEMMHALALTAVDKVELAVEVTPFPEAPRVVIGAINWKGQILPVLSMRRRLRAAERSIMGSDRIIIVQTSRRRLGLMVDEIVGVRQVPRSDCTGSDSLSDGLGCVTGATQCSDGLVLIHDLELFLTEEEEKALDNL